MGKQILILAWIFIVVYVLMAILIAIVGTSCADRHHINPLDPDYNPSPVITSPVWTLHDSLGYRYQISEKQWVTSAISCMYTPMNDPRWIRYVGRDIDVKFDVYTLFSFYPAVEPPKTLWIRKKGVNEP
jgi:hypothetical protein